MNWLISRTKDSQRGATVFLVAATIMIVLGVGALALDMSISAQQGQKLQNAADAAALAGVQAYRAGGNVGDEAAADAAVRAILAQNGLSADLVNAALVTFPDALTNTEVHVSITNPHPGRLLDGFTGADGGIERNATATFSACESLCTREVNIPSPFVSVNAEGDGDGYKPISVGDRMYAINHNNNQIVCVDRITQEACWCVNKHTDDPCLVTTDPNDWKHTRYAYASSGKHSPEMPHTAVYDTTIWWTTSDSTGTHLFCWETSSETPCSTSYPINARPRASSSDISSSKDRNRGGGTVLFEDEIYVFTDDHKVHCFDPLTRARCGTYSGPADTSLGVAGFPPNDPAADGNHGGSIDRIVDEDAKRIYSVLKIEKAADISGPYTCGQNLGDPLDKRVVIQMATANKWISGNTTDPDSSDKKVRTSDDGNDIKDRWDITDAGNGRFYVQNAVNGMYWDADGTNDKLEMSGSPAADDEWLFTDWDPVGRTYKIVNGATGNWIKRDGNDFRTVSGSSNATRFSVNHWQCEMNPLPPQGVAPTLPYKAGTWLHCFDTVTQHACSNFTASRIHTNAKRFNGRLFFYRDSTGDVESVCSTGFDGDVNAADFEIKCVNLFGIEEPLKTSYMASQFIPEIRLSLGQYPAAWGDPHYNEDNNRLFYPTNHRYGYSKILCWDFDVTNGFCGSVEGTTDVLNPVNEAYETRHTEDYGFLSEGDCVYALGHTALFHGFNANDIYEKCTGSEAQADINPCDCSGTYEYGTLVFDLDLSVYTSFEVIIENSAEVVVWPKNWQEGDPGHSLFSPHGKVIDLSDLPVLNTTNPAEDYVRIKVKVENAPGIVLDPNAPHAGQTFEVRYSRNPRLSE